MSRSIASQPAPPTEPDGRDACGSVHEGGTAQPGRNDQDGNREMRRSANWSAWCEGVRAGFFNQIPAADVLAPLHNKHERGHVMRGFVVTMIGRAIGFAYF